MKDLEGVLAGLLEEFRLLEEFAQAKRPITDQIAEILSDHAIYIEELGEEERRLVDRFLHDAFALWTAQDLS